jgi:hypothetical protein
MKNKGWGVFQIIQLILFLCVSVFLFTRTVDGHGAVQTFGAKLLSFVVWGITYLVILAIEWFIYFITRRSKK